MPILACDFSVILSKVIYNRRQPAFCKMSTTYPGSSEFSLQRLTWTPNTTSTDSPLNPSTVPSSRQSGDKVWSKLEETIPKDEEEWRTLRQSHAFDTRDQIQSKVSDMLAWRCHGNLRTLLCVAASAVVRYCKGPVASYSELRSSLGREKLSETTIVKYITSVLRFIKLIDNLFYLRQQHRIFEVMILYCRLDNHNGMSHEA